MAKLKKTSNPQGDFQMPARHTTHIYPLFFEFSACGWLSNSVEIVIYEILKQLLHTSAITVGVLRQ